MMVSVLKLGALLTAVPLIAGATVRGSQGFKPIEEPGVACGKGEVLLFGSLCVDEVQLCPGSDTTFCSDPNAKCTGIGEFGQPVCDCLDGFAKTFDFPGPPFQCVDPALICKVNEQFCPSTRNFERCEIDASEGFKCLCQKGYIFTPPLFEGDPGSCVRSELQCANGNLCSTVFDKCFKNKCVCAKGFTFVQQQGEFSRPGSCEPSEQVCSAPSGTVPSQLCGVSGFGFGDESGISGQVCINGACKCPGTQIVQQTLFTSNLECGEPCGSDENGIPIRCLNDAGVTCFRRGNTKQCACTDPTAPNEYKLCTGVNTLLPDDFRGATCNTAEVNERRCFNTFENTAANGGF